MTTILIPTRVRHAFSGGVSEVTGMLGAVASECGHSLIDLEGAVISGRFDYQPRNSRRVLLRRFLHLRTLAFFESTFPRTPLVFFQTSMGRNSVSRDMAYMLRCHRAGRRYSVFVHGWNPKFAAKLSASSRRRKKVAEAFNHAKQIFVLSPSFKNTLAQWGVDARKIIIETTMIDDSLLADFDLEEKIKKKAAQGLKILFMSRVLKEKGVHQALDAFHLHQRRFPSSTLVIAGDGKELAAVKDRVLKESIQGVSLAGFVEGAQKARMLAEADVFLLPSVYGEGLPISLLEAMAFGSTVISRPVGGIGAFFRDPEMGYLETGMDPKRYAILLDKVAEHRDIWTATARFNHEFSRSNTLASQVCRRILSEITKDLE